MNNRVGRAARHCDPEFPEDSYRGNRHTRCDELTCPSVDGDVQRNSVPLARPAYRDGREKDASSNIASNKTRQGYALRSTLKPAGYFFLPSAR